jgi:hypothetical protein
MGGPDFRSQEGTRTTGTYHIKGPLLIDPPQYDFKVAIVAKDLLASVCNQIIRSFLHMKDLNYVS